MSEDLIDCDSPFDYESFADYAHLVIQKIASEVMIDLNVEEFAACIDTAERLVA